MTATKQAIDFSNVKEQGDFSVKRKPEGDYKAKVTKVEDHESKSGNKQWVFTIELVSDKRATYPLYCGFGEKEAWKIRNLCIATGLQVPKKKVAVDPNKLVGKVVGITLEDDEYEGKMKSRITATFPVSELSGDEPEDTVSEDTDEVDDDLDLEEI